MNRVSCFFMLAVCLAAGGAADAADAEGAAQGEAGRKLASRWQASTFKAVHGTYSAWCGSFDVVSCGPGDPDGGYGRNYNETMEWRGTVVNPAAPCTVSVAANINLDTMWGYDYFFVSCRKAGGSRSDVFFQDGLFADLPVAAQVVYQPGEYLGANGDQVVVQFRVTSDGGWDGQDCLWPNDGAVQLDDVAITLSNGTGYSHDFEDGSLGDFRVLDNPASVPGVPVFAVDVHPNPFNPSTTITYRVGQPGRLHLSLYDASGRLVRRLVDGPVLADGAVVWDGMTGDGKSAPSGVYFVEARLDDVLRVGKLTLVR